MTGEQQEHIKGINQRFTEFNYAKYKAGVKEHVSLLSSLPVTTLGNNALEEVADLVNYLYSLNDNLELIRTRLTALKELLTDQYQPYYDDLFSADNPHRYLMNSFVLDIDDDYDPIRRIEAIERLLYGQER